MVPEPLTGPDATDAAQRRLLPLRAAVQAAEAIPLTSYEESEGDHVLPLLDETRAALARAIDAVAGLLEHYDAVAESRASVRRLRVDHVERELCGELERAMGEEDATVRKAQNLAFIARMGLRGRATSLGSLGPGSGKWEVIAAASSALREILKALGALELAVCEHEELPVPATFYVTELERSLQVRRAYRIFHADIGPAREVSGADVGLRLRRAANAIAKLAGRPVYASMRVHDRFMIRSVQRRLQAWLRGVDEEPRAREAAGVRLFQDLAHLAELMMGVNERAELRRHDEALCVEVMAALQAEQLEVPRAVASLAALQGRDGPLDALLAASSVPTSAALCEHLEALRARLAPRRESAPAPRPSAEDLDDDWI